MDRGGGDESWSEEAKNDNVHRCALCNAGTFHSLLSKQVHSASCVVLNPPEFLSLTRPRGTPPTLPSQPQGPQIQSPSGSAHKFSELLRVWVESQAELRKKIDKVSGLLAENHGLGHGRDNNNNNSNNQDQ